jgi:CDP-glucose 4,6-dehydratase
LDAVVKEELKACFSGRKVLVTGDSGFKGSWLSLALLELGAQVTGYSLPPLRAEDHFSVLKLGQKIRHIDGDVRDADHLRRVFQEVKPSVVFHLAAQPLVRLSYADPKTTFDTNVGGSVNILEAVRATPDINALVYVTSDKCYENKEWIWGYREIDELGGKDPYSASKGAAEVVFSSYQRSFFSHREKFGAASVRAGNVIGGGDWSADRIIPDCIRALMGDSPIVLRNPNSTRPWQHVLEPVFAYILVSMRLLQEPKRFASAWNIGPAAEDVRTVRELAEHVIATWGAGKLDIKPDPSAPAEAGLLSLNCDKARFQLKWKPAWHFETAVRETAQWYKSVAAEGAGAMEVSRAQIRKFMGQ